MNCCLLVNASLENGWNDFVNFFVRNGPDQVFSEILENSGKTRNPFFHVVCWHFYRTTSVRPASII